MLNLIKDMPDWMMGTILAGGGWFLLSYSVLAPRALEREVNQEIVPTCAMQLEGEQEIYLADALERAREAARHAREETARQLRIRQRELEGKLAEAAAFREVNRINRQSGLSDLLGSLGMPMALPEFDASVIEDELQSVRQRLSNINVPEKITIPKAPHLDLVKACICAAGEAVAGKRTAYTISLASFRMITPDRLLSLKSDLADALDTDICNAKPWEKLS